MAYLILPDRRTRQPQGVVRLGGPIGSKFCAGFVAGGSGVITTLNQSLAPVGTGSMKLAATAQGLAVKSTAPSDNRYQPLWPTANATDTPWERPTNQVTVAVAFRRTGVAYGNSPIFSNESPSISPYAAWGVKDASGAGNLRFETTAGGTYRSLEVASSITTTDLYIVVATYDGANMRLFKNGALIGGPTAATGAITYPNDANYRGPVVGNFYNFFDNRSFIGEIYGGAVAPVGISDAEAIALSQNERDFWGLLFAPTRRIWGQLAANAGTGGTIFESTFANTLSLADTYAALANYVSTYADSPTVTDSSSTSVIYTSTFDETIPVSDGPSADMGGTANRTQEESFSITDAYSASMVASATISETLSAEASLAASAIFNATFAETLPIVDGEEADAGRISDIAENVTVTDAYTAGIIAQATQAESVTTIDTYDTIAIYNPTLEETLPITDAVGATLTVPTSGTVDLSQESIDALALEIMNQLTSVPVRRL